MSPRSVAALLALVAVLAFTGVAAAGGPSAGVGDPVDAQPAAAGQSVGAAQETPTPANVTREPADVTFHVQLQADGDARWQVSTTYHILGENESAAFDEIAAEFEDSDAPLGLESFRIARDRASTETDREMEFRNVETQSTRNQTSGTLTLAFTWSNFARTQGNELYVDDAFNSTGGTWFPELTERQTLVIEPPSGYGLDSAPQGVEFVDGAARWEGPYQFDGPEPWIVYSGDAPTPTDTPPNATSTTGVPTTSGTATPGGGLGSAIPVALLVLLAGVSAAVLAVYMRNDDATGGGAPAATAPGDDSPGAAGETATEPDADDAGGTGPGPVEPADPGSPDAGAASGGEAAAAAAEADAAAAEADDVDETLLSDEERVERLLDRNGGRMKQANIVKETGWSNAKVSQLLSAMADDGRIDKLRIGRENLISFPDEDVTDLPSDEE